MITFEFTHGPTKLSLEKPPKFLSIDDDGDLLLTVENEADEKWCFKVSSKVLCLSSKVFRRMLGPDSQFSEATSTDEQGRRHVDVKGDELPAMDQILRSIHMRCHGLPSALKIQSIYEIAIICDKYDMAEALIPWFNLWVTGQKFPPEENVLEWLFVCWTFRLPRGFRNITKHLIETAVLNKESELVTKDGESFPEVMPSAIVEKIKGERKRILDALAALCTIEMAEFTARALKKTPKCAIYEKQDETLSVGLACENFSLGTFVSTLIQSSLWPSMLPQDNTPVTTVISALRNIRTRSRNLGSTYDIYGERYRSNHVHCGPADRIKKAVDEISDSFKGIELTAFYKPTEIFFK